MSGWGLSGNRPTSQLRSEMSSNCVKPGSETVDQRQSRQQQDHPYQISNVSGTLRVDSAMDRERRQGSGQQEKDERQEQKQNKPRRKDTPVLHAPPLIPGVKLMKGERREIHMEDEEKEGKM